MANGSFGESLRMSSIMHEQLPHASETLKEKLLYFRFRQYYSCVSATSAIARNLNNALKILVMGTARLGKNIRKRFWPWKGCFSDILIQGYQYICKSVMEMLISNLNKSRRQETSSLTSENGDWWWDWKGGRHKNNAWQQDKQSILPFVEMLWMWFLFCNEW